MSRVVKKMMLWLRAIGNVVFWALLIAYSAGHVATMASGMGVRGAAIVTTLVATITPIVAGVAGYVLAWKGYSRLPLRWAWDRWRVHPDVRRVQKEQFQWNGILILLFGLGVIFGFVTHLDDVSSAERSAHILTIVIAYFFVGRAVKYARSDYYLYGTLSKKDRDYELSWKDRLVGGKDNDEVMSWGRKFAKNTAARLFPHALGYRNDAMRHAHVPTTLGTVVVVIPVAFVYGLTNGSSTSMLFFGVAIAIVYWWSVTFLSRVINDRREVSRIRLSPYVGEER